jgi:hypothetical protein
MCWNWHSLANLDLGMAHTRHGMAWAVHVLLGMAWPGQWLGCALREAALVGLGVL